jgi:Uma2 family endonuclease
MRTLLPDPAPAEFEALLERRRRWGGDTRDEVWEGVLHVNPAPHGRHARFQAQLIELLGPLARTRGLTPLGEFNLGEPEDYRVPDGGLHRPGPDKLYNPTAALVIEIVSPGDETWNKLPFHAAHLVDELLIVDPAKQTVEWLGRGGDRYEPIARSRLVDLGPDELADQLDWPDASI